MSFTMSPRDPNCFTCQVNAGQVATAGGVIYEDAYWVAEHGVDLLVPGCTVLKPKHHAQSLPT